MIMTDIPVSGEPEVYYLESACGVGFFGDGEHIPKLAALPIEGINLSERPRFPFREYMMDCEYTISGHNHSSCAGSFEEA